METIEVMGFVDERHRLSGEVPASVSPGPVRVQLLVESTSGEIDPAEIAWESAVGREWETEWNDPREDIYSLDDGEPVDEPPRNLPEVACRSAITRSSA
jgi:hypothetical protein